jgi:serine protease AprX
MRVFSLGMLIAILAMTVPVRAEDRPYWIFFNDRGSVDVERAVAAKRNAADEPKRFSRRARIMSPERLFDERDLPVNEAYITAVKDSGGTIRHASRFLNAVSAMLDEDELTRIGAFPFVREIRPLMTLRRPSEPVREALPESGKAGKAAVLAYGNSFDQANIVGATGLHDLGYRGEGIRIAVFDSGFDNLSHAAFDSLQIGNTWDFVTGNDNPDGDNHGTEVLSVMGALAYGNMIGLAPDATYYLARTEIRYPSADMRIEEDNWVAAAEWADSLGVDVINSSLGYYEFGDGFSYTYADLDGRTAVTTVAADIAVEKGIVVVTSAGNEGNDEWHYITTPADGFGVLAIGAIDRNGVIAATSSRGPTSDGRIKPDFVALGVNVMVVNTGTASSYTVRSGTSYSSPAVAGAAALILEANPAWSTDKVKEALIGHASRKNNPDTDAYAYGYGLIDALASAGIDLPEPPVSTFRVLDPFPQPAVLERTADRVYFPMDIPQEGKTLTIRIYSAGGGLVTELTAMTADSGQLYGRSDAPNWDGTNATGDDVAPGVYFYTVELEGYGVHKGKLAVIR